MEKKFEKNVENKISNFLVYNIPRPFVSVHTKNQANWSSSLAGYAQHIYMNVLFYYKDFMLPIAGPNCLKFF